MAYCAHSIAQQLKDCRVGSRLLCLDCVDSTNTEAKRQAAANAPEGLAVLSDCQTAGRGRAGRSFHSPAGQGLYLSVLLRPKLPPEAVINFTAWTAVAVCDGVEAACGLRPRIKWTNDLVLNGKKLGGILTELSVDRSTGALTHLVAGIGINVSHGPTDFPEELRSMATSLQLAAGHLVDRNALAAQLLLALDRMYTQFPTGKQAYLDRYRQDCLTVGNPVRLFTPASSREAFATGIDDEFRLLVAYPDGTSEAVSAGEVSVRGMYGYV